jgi:hypothetical protein
MRTADAPRIGVYREALEFHEQRTTLLPADFYAAAMDRARPRAMTMTGLVKYDSLLAVTRLIDRGIAENKTTAAIADEISAVVREHGGTILPSSRFELVVHNALVTANAAGEWTAAMEFVEDRPYFQYRGPEDDRNSAICKRIHNLIVHYTDPILKHFWHPNHHHERHAWVTLRVIEVDLKDVYRSPDGYEYPVVGGQMIRPAPGWDFSAADAMAADDSTFIEGARTLGQQIQSKTARSYGLAPIVDADPAELLPMPQLGNSVPQAALRRAWSAFQRMVGIENESGAWLLDYASEGVRINRDTFDLALTDPEGNFAGGNGRYFPLIVPTLTDPFEVWLVPVASEKGTTLIKRYIGAFATPRGGVEAIVLDRTEDGWLWRVTTHDAEAQRVGLLVKRRGSR